jgi:predicted lipoprotein with Yx(FWY)xxD motif
MRYMRRRSLGLFMLLGAMVVTGNRAFAADPPPFVVTGGVLVSAVTGMTLYTYDRDVVGSGKSDCNGDCAMMWPPMLVVGGTPSGTYTIIVREGGEQQWVYKGQPLYLFSGDVNPGDSNGNGVNGRWKVATP